MTDEHRCVCCPVLRPNGEPRIYERAQVCEGCRNWLRSMLAEVVSMYPALTDHLERGQGNGQRVSGTFEAPLPLRVEPLDLAMPARVPNPSPAARTWPQDQLGRLSVASVLDSWVRDWRDTRGRGEHAPEPTVAVLAEWLNNRLDWACDEHPAVDDYAAELRDLVTVLRRITGQSKPRPEHLDVPCRRCDLLDLHRPTAGDYWSECASCGDLMTEAEYHRWVGLMAATVVGA